MCVCDGELYSKVKTPNRRLVYTAVIIFLFISSSSVNLDFHGTDTDTDTDTDFRNAFIV